MLLSRSVSINKKPHYAGPSVSKLLLSTVRAGKHIIIVPKHTQSFANIFNFNFFIFLLILFFNYEKT